MGKYGLKVTCMVWTTMLDCFQALYPIRQNLAMAAIPPVFFLFPDFFPTNDFMNYFI